MKYSIIYYKKTGSWDIIKETAGERFEHHRHEHPGTGKVEMK